MENDWGPIAQQLAQLLRQQQMPIQNYRPGVPSQQMQQFQAQQMAPAVNAAWPQQQQAPSLGPVFRPGIPIHLP